MEERSDQWCVINGSFQGQIYRKVKNYFVRQQCSRFIKRGYDILQTDCSQLLAAISEARDTLTLVLLNEGEETTHNIQIQKSKFKKAKVYRTSASEDMAVVKDGFRLKNNTLSIVLPKQSITIIVLK